MTTPLGESEAIDAVAAAVRRLFHMISERQARDLAASVLRDLRREGLHLVRGAEGAPPPMRPSCAPVIAAPGEQPAGSAVAGGMTADAAKV